MVVTTFLLCPKNERQQSVNDFWPCILENAWAVRRVLPHNRAIGCLSRQNLLQQHCYYILKMSVNGATTTLGLVSGKILGLCGDIKP